METMNNKKLSIVIMAAGRGTRMNSELPKVLHNLSGETLLNHVITTADKLRPENIVTVVGHEAQMVQDSVNKSDILFSIQKSNKCLPPIGTKHLGMSFVIGRSLFPRPAANRRAIIYK